MSASTPARPPRGFGYDLPLRVALYYVVLFASATAGWHLLPPAWQADLRAGLASTRGVGTDVLGRSAALEAATATVAIPPGIATAIAMTGALLLALPVAWTYMHTRQRKGYSQSTVQTLVLLPVVVAGVVVLVKSSLALAFSLAGIVAAVRFRTALDDAKDAVFVFLATAVGLAAGVQLDVAAVLSVFFSALTMLFFYTDFARTPPALEGVRAQRQLERAMAIANRTSQFVARVDDEVLRALSPAQLDALGQRLRQRRDEVGPDLPSTLSTDELDTTVRVLTPDASALRAVLEPALGDAVKRWRFVGQSASTEAPGATIVEYRVKARKGISAHSLHTAVDAAAGAHAMRVEVS
ncbi:MAG: DUF4956 domain-containing protein [Gemmatimonadaceae bacterium]|jgi:hypothetical protein|nr:DUF4956 domain-containing protein [Gemmatimonadaceae bacterium]